MAELLDYERCENCKSFSRLKHKFAVGVGYQDSFCCTLFAKEKDGFVVETTKIDMCECFQRRAEDA